MSFLVARVHPRGAPPFLLAFLSKLLAYSKKTDSSCDETSSPSSERLSSSSSSSSLSSLSSRLLNPFLLLAQIPWPACLSFALLLIREEPLLVREDLFVSAELLLFREEIFMVLEKLALACK